MKTPSQLSTAECRHLQTVFANPDNMTEALILRGVQAELAEPERREAGFMPETVESLQEQIRDTEAIEKENSDLTTEVAELKSALESMTAERDAAIAGAVAKSAESKVEGALA